MVQKSTRISSTAVTLHGAVSSVLVFMVCLIAMVISGYLAGTNATGHRDAKRHLHVIESVREKRVEVRTFPTLRFVELLVHRLVGEELLRVELPAAILDPDVVNLMQHLVEHDILERQGRGGGRLALLVGLTVAMGMCAYAIMNGTQTFSPPIAE